MLSSRCLSVRWGARCCAIFESRLVFESTLRVLGSNKMVINVKWAWKQAMKRVLSAAMVMALAISPAMPQETCSSKAVGKNGRPLAGAALNSFLKKCKRQACLPKAMSAEGKKLSGAAKNSFMRKCMRNV